MPVYGALVTCGVTCYICLQRGACMGRVDDGPAEPDNPTSFKAVLHQLLHSKTEKSAYELVITVGRVSRLMPIGHTRS